MKALAKDKLERAILDVAYANDSYEKEMEQASLLEEAKNFEFGELKENM